MGAAIKWGLLALAGVITLGAVVNAKKAKKKLAEANA